MATKEMDALREKLKLQSEAQHGALAQDPELVRRDWVQRIDNLFSQIETWVDELRRDELIDLSRESYHLEEEFLGEYESQVLLLVPPHSFPIEVLPCQRMTRSAVGRVDIVCGADRVMLLRQSDDAWNIVNSLIPTLQVEPLTEASFANLLNRLVG